MKEKEYMKYTILVADDEVELLDILELYFKREDWEIIKAENGEEALKKYNDADLVVLDIMMPKVDGIKVLQKIRENSQIPVIMLTAKTQDFEKIIGLDLGADDYITKPYNPMEVVARVKAQLRRNYEVLNKRENRVLQIGNMKLIEDTGEFFYDDKSIELTSTEFKILNLFMKTQIEFSPKNRFSHMFGVMSSLTMKIP